MTEMKIKCDFCGVELTKKGIEPLVFILNFANKYRPKVTCIIENESFDICRVCFNTAMHQALK